MCTVALFLSFLSFFLLPHPQPTEMAQLDGSITALSREHSPKQGLKVAGKCFLATPGSEEEQRGELVRVLQVGTVLQLHGDRLRESPREVHPVDPTDQLCVIRELVLATQAGLDGHDLGRSAWF